MTTTDVQYPLQEESPQLEPLALLRGMLSLFLGSPRTALWVGFCTWPPACCCTLPLAAFPNRELPVLSNSRAWGEPDLRTRPPDGYSGS